MDSPPFVKKAEKKLKKEAPLLSVSLRKTKTGKYFIRTRKRYSPQRPGSPARSGSGKKAARYFMPSSRAERRKILIIRPVIYVPR